MMVTTHQLAEAIDALVLNSTTCFGSGLFLDFKVAHYRVSYRLTTYPPWIN